MYNSKFKQRRNNHYLSGGILSQPSIIHYYLIKLDISLTEQASLGRIEIGL